VNLTMSSWTRYGRHGVVESIEVFDDEPAPRRRSAVRDQVADGVAVIGEFRSGWAKMVDPATLDVVSSPSCVLARVYERPEDGAAELEGSHHGFRQVAFCGQGPGVKDAWVEEITARQG
jgi:hypothetical protein